MQRVGSRAQVMHGNAKMTGGGLKKKDLKYNKQGKIVSKKMSQRAKKEKRLQKAGYTTQKGQFGTVRSMKGGGIITVGTLNIGEFGSVNPFEFINNYNESQITSIKVFIEKLTKSEILKFLSVNTNNNTNIYYPNILDNNLIN